MSTTTTNFGLVKFDLNDPADITQLNVSMDKIDEQLGKAIYSVTVSNTVVRSNGELATVVKEIYEQLKTNTVGKVFLEILQHDELPGDQWWLVEVSRYTGAYSTDSCCVRFTSIDTPYEAMVDVLEPTKPYDDLYFSNFRQLNTIITYGTEDIEAGSASYEINGSIHFVIE